MHDPVTHPSHYRAHPSGIECIEVTRHMNFNLGNAIKYIWRSGLKSEYTNVEDLQKAIWYLRDEINKYKTTTVHNVESGDFRERPRIFTDNESLSNIIQS